jgi:hypothetical protein
VPVTINDMDRVKLRPLSIFQANPPLHRQAEAAASAEITGKDVRMLCCILKITEGLGRSWLKNWTLNTVCDS